MSTHFSYFKVDDKFIKKANKWTVNTTKQVVASNADGRSVAQEISSFYETQKFITVIT
jgi:hypothetical protein